MIFLWNKIKLNFFLKSYLNLTKFELTFPPPRLHILVFYIPVINIVNLIDCYLNYCKVLKLELKTRQTSKQTNIQTNRELKNWGASSLRRKRNSGLSGPIPVCMTNVCIVSQSRKSLPVTIKIVKIWSAACNAMYCNVTQARCPTLVWH